MPDITKQILEDLQSESDPSEEIIGYSEGLLYLHNSELETEFTSSRVINHLLGWVKAGLLLERVRNCRLYRDKFKRWQDYCEQIVHKSSWQVAKIIKAARIVLALAKAGFSILPSCVSQAERLNRYFDENRSFPNQETLIEKWQQVISRLPSHSINANSIDEELGHMKRNRKRISIEGYVSVRLDRLVGDSDQIKNKNQMIGELIDEYESSRDPLWGLPKSLQKRVIAIANREGISVYEVLEKYLDASLPEDEEPSSSTSDEDGAADDEEVSEVSEYRIARWEADLEDLIAEHDEQLTLICLWFKSLFSLDKLQLPLPAS